MPSPGAETQLPLRTYSIQLQDAYVYEAGIRRDARPSDLQSARFDPTLRAIVIPAGGKRLAIALTGVVTFPFSEAGLLIVECTISGQFVAASRKKKAELEAFARREAVLLLWPYLRGAIGQLAQLTGIQVPPLPIVDVLEMLRAKPSVDPSTYPRQPRGPRAEKARLKSRQHSDVVPSLTAGGE
jgi:preprotein translocase subunit SecB